MKAIIPTAGVGSRLRPLTHTVPKVLLQVAGKPILGHILDKLVLEKVEEVTLVVGYLGEAIKEYVNRQYSTLKANFIYQEEARGLGHAIHLTAPVHRHDKEPILIILGDTLIEANLSLLKSSEVSMIGVREVADPRRFGICELENGYIKRMVEKPEVPPTNLAIVGIYYLRHPEMLYNCLDETIESGVTVKGEFQVTSALQLMIDKGERMKAFTVDGWHDCGTPETLLATNRDLLQRQAMQGEQEFKQRFPNIAIRPPVFIAPTAHITDSIIGPDVSIGDNAIVSGSIVSNSILNEGACVTGALLQDSIIGNRAQVAGQALRLFVGDQSEIRFDHEK